MRYFFDISYDGTGYHGWQRQKNALSVQEVIEDHMSTLLRNRVDITGSGRTDAGVHARQQYFHTDLTPPIKPDLFEARLNSFLPSDICVNTIRAVREDAHARFDAAKRSYEYWIVQKKDPFLRRWAYLFFDNLDIVKLNKAAKTLVGKKDFESFSRVKTDVDHFVCTVSEAEWVEEDNILKFRISANRFLRGMVKAMVGTLMEVGSGKRSLTDMKQILGSKDRREAGRAVPAKGLYLTRVIYPPSVFIIPN